MVETSITVPFNGGTIDDNIRQIDHCILETGKSLQVWRQDNPDWAFARVWNYGFSSSTEGNIRMFTGAYSQLTQFIVQRLSNTQAIILYNGDNTWYGRVLTVDVNDDITESAETNLGTWPAQTRGKWDGFQDTPIFWSFPIDSSRFWLIEADPLDSTTFYLHEFSVSGSTITHTLLQTVTNSRTDADNGTIGVGVRPLSGTSNYLVWVGNYVSIVDNAGTSTLAAVTGSNSNLSGKSQFTVISESSTSILIFDDDFNAPSVSVWDGTDAGGVSTPVQYSSDGRNGTPNHVEKVAQDTFILWTMYSNSLYAKVVRRLDAQTWETSTPTDFLTTGNRAGIQIINNEITNPINITAYQTPYELVRQYDADTFVIVYLRHNNENAMFSAYFMRQT